MTPLDIWRGAFTRRWHMNPDLSHLDDPICGHQGRCALLVLLLFPDASRDLLRAAVTHDQAEAVVGDLAMPFKQRGGDLVAAHAALEAAQLAQMGLAVDLDRLDAFRLTLVDRLDCYLFAALRVPHVLARADWIAAGDAIYDLAVELGVGPVVAAMLQGART